MELPPMRVVGFQICKASSNSSDTVSPTSVLSARGEQAAEQQVESPSSSLAAMLQRQLPFRPFPRLTINTKAGGGMSALKKSKSHADLHRRVPSGGSSMALPAARNSSQPATPGSRASSASTPLRIPSELSRAHTCPIDLVDLPAMLAMSRPGHRPAGSPPALAALPEAAPLPAAAAHARRPSTGGSGSIVRDLFDAQADAVTAQAAAHELAAALEKQHGEVERLRRQLHLVERERDLLRDEGAAAPGNEALFPLDEPGSGRPQRLSVRLPAAHTPECLAATLPSGADSALLMRD